MAKEKKNNIEFDESQYTQEQVNYVYENRRYVGVKETVGFVLWDAAQSFNIDAHADTFINNVFQLDLAKSALAKTINLPWDLFNDVIFATIVDRTRTRWGKFRPYLMGLAIPGFIGTVLFWLLPIFFHGSETESLQWAKFAMYLALAMVRDGIGTFQSISRTGLITTITPHPVDRIRLVTIAEWASGQFGEKLPDQIFTAVLDLIGNGKLDAVFKAQTRSQIFLRSFIGMGTLTTLVSSGMSFWFFMNSRERVLQSVEKPNIAAGLKSIVTNKPVLLMTLSGMLNSFGIGGSQKTYYRDVLNFQSMTMIAGIPAAPISPLSFALVPYFRRKFSTRFLYIWSNYSSNILKIPVFLIGCIGLNWKTMEGGWYLKKLPMAITMAAYEFIWTFFYGTKRVISTEMYNETMDYCEWKNGYRTEAMTSVAKGLAAKAAASLSGIVNNLLLSLVGYDQSAYVTAGKTQSNKVNFFIFAYFAIFPTITGSFGIIPMLFYDLVGKKRELMYAELLKRRAETSAEMTSAEKAAESSENQTN